MNNTDRAALQEVVDEINKFDDKTEADEYTDTGEAWELLNQIKSTLKGLIRIRSKKK